MNDVYYQSKIALEKQSSNTSDQIDNQQSFTTCCEKDFSVNHENQVQQQLSDSDDRQYDKRIRPQSMVDGESHTAGNNNRCKFYLNSINESRNFPNDIGEKTFSFLSFKYVRRHWKLVVLHLRQRKKYTRFFSLEIC